MKCNNFLHYHGFLYGLQITNLRLNIFLYIYYCYYLFKILYLTDLNISSLLISIAFPVVIQMTHLNHNMHVGKHQHRYETLQHEQFEGFIIHIHNVTFIHNTRIIMFIDFESYYLIVFIIH